MIFNCPFKPTGQVDKHDRPLFKCPLCYRTTHIPDLRRNCDQSALDPEELNRRLYSVGIIKEKRRGTACALRGQVIGLRVCEACGGSKTKIKIFACTKHGECSLAPVPGVKLCGFGSCADYVESLE